VGKRELALIVGFVLLGLVAYQLVAAPPEHDDAGLSLTGLADRIRTEMRSRGARIERRKTARSEVGPGVAEIVVTGFSGRLSVVGSATTEVTAELAVNITGLDEREATARADAVDLGLVRDASAMIVQLALPPELRPSDVALSLDVPERLLARLQVSGGPTQARRVAAVALEAVGDVRVRDVDGPITGEHRAGDLRVTRVGSLRLVTRNSGVRIEEVGGSVDLDAVEGRVRLRTIGGAVRLQARDNFASLDAVDGPIVVHHTDGRLVLDHVRSRLEAIGERSRISVEFEVPTPAHVETRDAPVDIALPPGGVMLEATVRDGELALQGVELDPTNDDGARRAVGAVGGGGPTVTALVSGGTLTVRR